MSICPYLRPIELDDVKRYRDAGADQVVLFPMAADVDGLTAAIDAFAEAIVEPARRL